MLSKMSCGSASRLSKIPKMMSVAVVSRYSPSITSNGDGLET